LEPQQIPVLLDELAYLFDGPLGGLYPSSSVNRPIVRPPRPPSALILSKQAASALPSVAYAEAAPR